MKIDRMIGILSILLQRETVTAPCLAERFEVSRRTIQRDIESLCRAGIPLVTKQGANGGVSIMENYRMNQTLLTAPEMQDILAGLRSLDSVNGTNQVKRLMDKLCAGSSEMLSGDSSVLIDLSSWYKDALAPKIALIRRAIDERRLLSFSYFSPGGESLRTLEPYYLIFHWSSWYVWGWCRLRSDTRLFKLNRMEDVALGSETFVRRELPPPDLSIERVFPCRMKVEALFDADCKWRLIEEYGRRSFEEQPDGRLLFRADFTNEEDLLPWILSFREKAELLRPIEMREKIRESLGRMLDIYSTDEEESP